MKSHITTFSCGEIILVYVSYFVASHLWNSCFQIWLIWEVIFKGRYQYFLQYFLSYTNVAGMIISLKHWTIHTKVFMTTPWNVNSVHISWPFSGISTDDWGNPLTKPVMRCFGVLFVDTLKQIVGQTVELLVIGDAMTIIWRHCNTPEIWMLAADFTGIISRFQIVCVTNLYQQGRTSGFHEVCRNKATNVLRFAINV